MPDSFRRDRTWYAACLSHALAGAGEPEHAMAVALASVRDAADVGRPHAWNELHATATHLTRRGAKEGHELASVLRSHD